MSFRVNKTGFKHPSPVPPPPTQLFFLLTLARRFLSCSSSLCRGNFIGGVFVAIICSSSLTFSASGRLCFLLVTFLLYLHLYSWTLMARTSLDPCKFVRGIWRSSHWGLIMVPGQESNGDTFGKSSIFYTIMHNENMPIQMYRKFHLQKMKIFR